MYVNQKRMELFLARTLRMGFMLERKTLAAGILCSRLTYDTKIYNFHHPPLVLCRVQRVSSNTMCSLLHDSKSTYLVILAAMTRKFIFVNNLENIQKLMTYYCMYIQFLDSQCRICFFS